MAARAIASICCSPPLIPPATWSRRSCRRGKTSYQWSMSAAMSASLRVKAPRRRFSSTVRSTKVPRPWGTWATPRRTISSGFLPPTDVPSTMTDPLVTIIPLMARMVVVLPAPLAPRMTTVSPASTVKDIPRRT